MSPQASDNSLHDHRQGDINNDYQRTQNGIHFYITADLEKQLAVLECISLLKNWSAEQKPVQLIVSLPAEVRDHLKTIKDVANRVKQERDKNVFDKLKAEHTECLVGCFLRKIP
ncbi:hypothetical protein RF11_02727 [Thelohanellus kitauei]|uniref:Uncharacterized protein n=1 Tax=Thelohanellus kitauei TaxID=669202 RepID=A0A0C2MUE8_THEKT|nr:hypothetical protein RF11_02727 [Thelohanellus kitauei]